MEILEDEELSSFKKHPKLTPHLATPLVDLTVKQLLEAANLLGIDVQVMLGRIIEAMGGMG